MEKSRKALMLKEACNTHKQTQNTIKREREKGRERDRESEAERECVCFDCWPRYDRK